MTCLINESILCVFIAFITSVLHILQSVGKTGTSYSLHTSAHLCRLSSQRVLQLRRWPAGQQGKVDLYLTVDFKYIWSLLDDIVVYVKCVYILQFCTQFVEKLSDMIWKCHVVTVDRLVLCLVSIGFITRIIYQEKPDKYIRKILSNLQGVYLTNYKKLLPVVVMPVVAMCLHGHTVVAGTEESGRQ